MNIPYEIFLTIQLMHLTCRKDRVQFPTRKEGWDLFRRTSDNSSRNNPEWRIIWQDFKRSQTQCSYVTLLSNIIDAKPSSYAEVAKKKGKEIPIQEEWCLGCGIETWREVRSVFHMDLQDPTCSIWKHHGIQGNIRSMRLLTERRHRLRRDICSHWKFDKKTHVCKISLVQAQKTPMG